MFLLTAMSLLMEKAILEDDYRWLKSNIKSTSLLANVLIKNKANDSGAYEALLLRDGFLTEAPLVMFLWLRTALSRHLDSEQATARNY